MVTEGGHTGGTVVIRIGAPALERMLGEDPEFRVAVLGAALNTALKNYMKSAADEVEATKKRLGFGDKGLIESAIEDAAAKATEKLGRFVKDSGGWNQRKSFKLLPKVEEEIRAAVSYKIAEIKADLVKESEAKIRVMVDDAFNRLISRLDVIQAEELEERIRAEVDRRINVLYEQASKP